MQLTGAQAMIKCLEAEGVKVIFGYPGAAICPFYDALTGSSIRHILVRQEQNAGHAASGYARITRRPAVCVATSGPGALNLLTAVATAYVDSVPLVVITGQVARSLIGKDVFQEADVTGAAEPFVKHSYLIKDVKDLPRVFKEAFYIAGTGRQGPVLIDVPVDVQNERFSFSYPDSVNIRGYKPTVKGHAGQIKKVAQAITEAQRPLIVAGGGLFATEARYRLVELAERCEIPVVTTMMGIGGIPTEHPLYYGMLGMHGKQVANRATQEADLLFVIGARLGDRAVSNPALLEGRLRVVHIDIDPAEIGKNMEANIPLVGDANVILGQLLEQVPECTHSAWRNMLDRRREEYRPQLRQFDGCINPKLFLERLSELADPDAVVVADVGQNQIWTANHFKIREGRFLTTGGMGTMGYSLGAGIGAKLAEPERQVITVGGDGSFQMQMMELATMCQHQVPLKMVIMSNLRLGMVYELQKNNFAGNYSGVFLDGSPDIPKLAGAYGIPAERIYSMDQADTAIGRLLKADTPYLLECIVNQDESSL